MIAVRHNLAILDNDEKYAVRLMEFINHMKGTLFIASVFTQAADYLIYAKEHEVDILLCSEECIDSINLDETQDVVFMLLKADKKNASNYLDIHKYQSAVGIYNKIIDFYNSQKIKNKASNVLEGAVINGIIPLFSHELCFYFGVLYADYCSQKQKTLYVSFDPLFTAKIFRCEEKKMGITEAICMLKSNPEDLSTYLRGIIIHTDSCDVLGGCAHWADCTEIEEEAALLIQKLIEFNSYGRVIIDFGGLYRMAVGLFKICQKLNIPKPFNEYGYERMKACVRQADLMGINIKEQTEYLQFNDTNLEDINSSLYKEDTLTKLRKSHLMDIVENIYEGR